MINERDLLGQVTRTADDTYTVRFERLLAHPPERVWAALTDPDETRHWFTEMRMEPRAGGGLHFDFGEQGEAYGTVVTWEPPRVLEHTWAEAGRTSHVRWELIQKGGETRLTLTHTGLSPDAPHEYGAGWHDFLDRLPPYLASGEVPVGEEGFEGLLEKYRRLVETGAEPPSR